MASWDFDTSADGWEFEGGTPPANGVWANQRLEIESSGWWSDGRWYYEPVETYAVTGATLGGSVWHGGNVWQWFRIYYTDGTMDQFNVPTAGAGTWSVSVTAANDGKQILRFAWECWPIHESAGVNWLDDAWTSDVATAVTGVVVSGEACGETGTNYTFTATVVPVGATLPITYVWSSDGLQSGQGTATAVYNWSTVGIKTVEITASNAYGGPFSDSMTINVSAGSIRADIYAIVSVVSSPDAGQVHDYKRWAVLYPDYLAKFKSDIGGSDYVRGCDVEAGPFTEERVEFHSTGKTGILRRRTFYVNAYLTWDDSGESEKTAEALTKAMGDALDDSDVLHSSCHYYHTEPAQLVNYESRLFGSVLIHYARVQVNVVEFLDGGTAGGTTSAGSIREDIYDIVNAVANIGQVHDYKRWASLYPDYLALFKSTISGSDYIRGCDVEAGPFSEERVEFRSTGKGGILRTWTFYVNGYLTWNDADESEKTAEALAVAVCDALDNSSVLHTSENYYYAEQAQLVNYEPRLFGSGLVHYFRIQQNVTEYLT